MKDIKTILFLIEKIKNMILLIKQESWDKISFVT